MKQSLQLSLKVVFVLLAASFWLDSTAESRGRLECGDVITEDTTLGHDLLDCPGDGLIIGADGITLRLNGHMISHLSPLSDVHLSLKRRVAESAMSMDEVIEYARSEPSGVAVDDKNHVSILGPGIIRGFFSGSISEFSDRIRISGVTFVNNVLGIVLTNETSRSLVDANTVINEDGCVIGILIGGNDAGVGPNSILYNILNRGFIRLNDDGLTHVFFNSIFSCSNAISMSLSMGDIINGNAMFHDSKGESVGMFKAARDNKISNNKSNQPIRLFEEGVSDNRIYLNTIQEAAIGIEITGGSDLINAGNIVEANRLLNNNDQILDFGEDTIIRDNFCDPPDEDPPCSTDFDPGEVVDSDVDSVLDRDDECPDSDLQAAVVINGIDTNLANRLTERSGCTMMDLIHEAAVAADDRSDFIGAVALLTRTWIDDDLIDEEDAGIIRTAASGSPLF